MADFGGINLGRADVSELQLGGMCVCVCMYFDHENEQVYMCSDRFTIQD